MEILLENPIILVIIIGIISSYFKKMKGEQPENGEKSKPKQHRVPPVSVGTGARNKKRQRAEEQRVQHQNAQTKPVNTRNDRNNNLDQRTNDSRNLVENNRESLSYHNQKAMQAKVPEPNTIQIDKDRLIDGIIWSEVLGPPRSKRPHRSIKNN